MSIPTFPETFRAYLAFANAKASSDSFDAYEYSSGAMDVVMNFIADNINDATIRRLAFALGQYEVGADED